MPSGAQFREIFRDSARIGGKLEDALGGFLDQSRRNTTEANQPVASAIATVARP
jgi:hypothetical protein